MASLINKKKHIKDACLKEILQRSIYDKCDFYNKIKILNGLVHNNFEALKRNTVRCGN